MMVNNSEQDGRHTCSREKADGRGQRAKGRGKAKGARARARDNAKNQGQSQGKVEGKSQGPNYNGQWPAPSAENYLKTHDFSKRSAGYGKAPQS